jgi:hypothetical protein
MPTRRFVAFLAVAASFIPSVGHAQTLPERAVRRDIPLTSMIRRAFAAGTRDSTGRPGRAYWQLWTDYTITARLDAATSIVTGTETIVVRNPSPDPLTSIHIRLYQNLYAPHAMRSRPVPDLTGGMPVTRITVNQEPVDLNPPPPARGRNQPPPPVRLAAYGLDQTVARITLPTPVRAGGSVTLEVDWSFGAPWADGPRGLRMGRWADSLYQMAQWYPQVAVFDDLREGGWDTDLPRRVRVLQQLRPLRRDG